MKRPSRSEGHATLGFLSRGPSLRAEAGTLAGRRQVAGRAWGQARRSRWSAMRFWEDCTPEGCRHVHGGTDDEFGRDPWEVAEVVPMEDRPGWMRLYVELVETVAPAWEGVAVPLR